MATTAVLADTDRPDEEAVDPADDEDAEATLSSLNEDEDGSGETAVLDRGIGKGKLLAISCSPRSEKRGSV